MSASTNPLTPTFTARLAGCAYRVELSTGPVLADADLTALGREVARHTYGHKRWAHAHEDQRVRWAAHEAGVIAAQCSTAP